MRPTKASAEALKKISADQVHRRTSESGVARSRTELVTARVALALSRRSQTRGRIVRRWYPDEAVANPKNEGSFSEHAKFGPGPSRSLSQATLLELDAAAARARLIAADVLKEFDERFSLCFGHRANQCGAWSDIEVIESFQGNCEVVVVARTLWIF
jgi:hypothetical protein